MGSRRRDLKTQRKLIARRYDRSLTVAALKQRAAAVPLLGILIAFASVDLFCGMARGETVVLKNGSFVEGQVVLQTATSLRVKTRFGTRTFSKKDVDQVMES